MDDARTGRHLRAPVVLPALHVHMVDLTAPHLPHVPQPHLPDRLRPHVDPRSVRGRALWLGGLGGLAVVGVLDWPVAAAVAAGTWVAERRARAYLKDRQPAADGTAAAESRPAPRVPAPRRTTTRKAMAGKTTARKSTARKSTERQTTEGRPTAERTA